MPGLLQHDTKGCSEAATQAAANLQLMAEMQSKIRKSLGHCMLSLKGKCPGCFTIGNVMVPKHQLGVGCRKALNIQGHMNNGYGWIAYKKQLAPVDTRINFCYGCNTPYTSGHRFTSHSETLGPLCPYLDIVAQIVWCVFKTPRLLRQMMAEFGIEEDFSIAEFTDWCNISNDMFYSNYIRVFYWLCKGRGLIELDIWSQCW